MKKSFLTAILAVFTLGVTTVYGQFVYDANGNATIDRAGSTNATSITINNTTPGLYSSSTLNIGNYQIAQRHSGNYCGNGAFSIGHATNVATARITMYNSKISFNFGGSGLACSTGGLYSPAKYLFDTLTAMNRLYVGNVFTTMPTLNNKYLLSVGGSIVCEELVVKLQANWADYVFASDYTLMPLGDVKKFIAANSHLPGVPTAAEIEQTGVQTGEMLTIQMKKIEELTLYLIQMEERIKELEAKNKALQNTNGQ
jgi:hypothetical protein